MPLAYDIAGDAGGTAVMMIHPLGADRTFWHETCALLGPGLRTTTCDLPGSGESQPLSAPLTMERTVREIEALRNELGIGRMIVIGCAVGAMAGAAYTAAHADNVAALIMSNPGIRIAGDAASALHERAELVRRAGMAALLPGAIENAFFGYAGTEARRRYEARFLAQSPENYAFAAMGAAGSDVAGCFERIACPVLLVRGVGDKLFQQQHAQEIMALAPEAELVEFADGAHFIPYQQPSRFAEVVSDFIDRHALRSAA